MRSIVQLPFLSFSPPHRIRSKNTVRREPVGSESFDLANEELGHPAKPPLERTCGTDHFVEGMR